MSQSPLQGVQIDSAKINALERRMRGDSTFTDSSKRNSLSGGNPETKADLDKFSDMPDHKRPHTETELLESKRRRCRKPTPKRFDENDTHPVIKSKVHSEYESPAGGSGDGNEQPRLEPAVQATGQIDGLERSYGSNEFGLQGVEATLSNKGDSYIDTEDQTNTKDSNRKTKRITRSTSATRGRSPARRTLNSSRNSNSTTEVRAIQSGATFPMSSDNGNASNIMSGSNQSDQLSLRDPQQVHALLEQWQRRALNAERQLQAQRSDSHNYESETHQLRDQLAYLNEQYNREREEWKLSKSNSATSLARLVRQMMEEISRAKRKALSDEQHRLGRIVPHRTGPHSVYEAWEDGAEIRRVTALLEDVRVRRESLEKQQRQLSNAARRRKAAVGRKKVDKPNQGTVNTYEETEFLTGASVTDIHATPSSEDSSGDSSSPTYTMATANPPLRAYDHSFGPFEPHNLRTSPATMPPPPARSCGIQSDILSELRRVEAEETVKTALAVVRREEARLDAQMEHLKREKAVLQKELKRCRDEDMSRFSSRPVLGDRYILLNLLGKGGFSEVWRALDLVTVQETAVKVHQLSSTWNDVKKSNYIRHATREYSIHRTLKHPHVVQLLDVFEIDVNSFATVLEYCPGHDLDQMLKQHKQLPEREARAVLLQILSALRYLNKCEDILDTDVQQTSSSSHSTKSDLNNSSTHRRIIHYDLKPGNILFDAERKVKVTDFGLSKVLEEADGTDASSMELTSQGAGTYWYLPPECFHVGPSPPRISDKVDVWSVGIIFYQMLFGKRPFGDGQSQEKLLHDKVILRAGEVTFSDKPPVSAEAKQFIRRCLAPSQHVRPDVRTISQDPYLRMKLR